MRGLQFLRRAVQLEATSRPPPDGQIQQRMHTSSLDKTRLKLQPWWALTKSPQTGLLLFTGMAGFMSARCPLFSLGTLLWLSASLLLAIVGSTMLNMVFDRQLDVRMVRTRCRPIPSGALPPAQVSAVGLTLAALGVGLGLALDPLFGAIVLAGVFFDLVVYTLWLKRRTPWSIVWGGVAGAMPLLAGRALGIGAVDGIGVLLSLGVLFWIPTHILTFHLRYRDDYARAGIPTFPSRYGDQATRIAIAISSVAAGFVLAAAAVAIGLWWGFVHLLAALSTGLMLLALLSLLRPSERLNLGLFKYASLYMLTAMLLLVFV
jgi:protoheme IX farnesyltransferase